VLFVIGMILGLAYLLRLLLTVGWGKPSQVQPDWKDMNLREWIYLAPLGLLVIYLGVAPGKALSFIGPSVDHLLSEYQREKNMIYQSAPDQEIPEFLSDRKNSDSEILLRMKDAGTAGSIFHSEGYSYD
jgi:NADH-quinone oxidoreductase subunit M